MRSFYDVFFYAEPGAAKIEQTEGGRAPQYCSTLFIKKEKFYKLSSAKYLLLNLETYLHIEVNDNRNTQIVHQQSHGLFVKGNMKIQIKQMIINSTW